jgi:hypothetical protein
MHDFQKSLKVGSDHEKKFLKYHSNILVKNVGRECDFFTLYDHSRVELKSDTHDMKTTSNFFFEHYSVLEKSKLGGPWQSYSHNVKFFVYFFPKNETYFVFYLPNLISVLNVIEKSLAKIHIRNVGYTTTGFKIRREDLKPIYTEHKLREENKVWTFKK